MSSSLAIFSTLDAAEVNGTRLYGVQMVSAMNALGLDYMTFGNHEFDLTRHDPPSTQRIMQEVAGWQTHHSPSISPKSLGVMASLYPGGKDAKSGVVIDWLPSVG